MFTGLIQAVGKVGRQGKNLRVEGCEPFSPLLLGDSVAVDGVCLTVVSLIPGGFLADVSEETLMRTTLGQKAENNGIVNLEPALRFSDRIGGHLVSGHVDDLGKIISIERLPRSWNTEVSWRNIDFGRYICKKASICLDGISLTIADCSKNGDKFSIAVIPHTWNNTSLQYLEEGSLVNLEIDLMAKYAEKLLSNIKANRKNTPSETINASWLEKHGWT
tara:strand:- start:2160 stop:2816 length:657 start_codon:yes stop_codon:yes gene_type:complete